MAAAAPSPLASSVEKTNGAKLSRLLIDGGSTVLRRIFDRCHPSANLLADLNANYHTLNNLLRRRVLHTPQWDLLFPPGGAIPDSNTFDITLLFLLLTNICGLCPPSSGWHTKPPASNTSFEANLARIKFFRNKLYGHVATTGIDTPNFSALWLEISAVLVALGLPQAEIDRLKAERCGEKDFIDVLFEWADSEEDIKSQLKDIRQYQSKVQQAVDEVHLTHLKDRKILLGRKRKLEEVLQVETKTQQTVDEVRQTQIRTLQTVDEVRQSQSKTQQTVDEVRQSQSKTQQTVDEVRQSQSKTQQTVDKVRQCQTKTQQTVVEVRQCQIKTQQTVDEVRQSQIETQQTVDEVRQSQIETQQTVDKVRQSQIKTQQTVDDVGQSQIETQQTVDDVRQNQLQDRGTILDSNMKLQEVFQIDAKTHQVVTNVRETQIDDSKAIQEIHDTQHEFRKTLQETKSRVEEIQQTHEKLLGTQDERFDCLRQDLQQAAEDLEGQREKHRENEILKKLAKLETLKNVRYHADRYVEGTRLSIFAKVESWLNDRSSPNRVMVISGNAGMGKSVISAVMCEKIQEAGQLAGSHFCQHDRARHRNPKVMLQSLASQLCDFLPDYKKALVEKLSRNMGVEINSMEVKDLFEVLFEEPLTNLNDPGLTYLMIVDGLDESEFQGRNELLHVIANYFQNLPLWIRFLVTTRPERSITENLRNLHPLQLDPKVEENVKDIQLCFQKQIGHLLQPEHQGKILQALAQKSEGVILYAHYLVDFIQKEVPVLTPELLDSILPLGISSVYQSYFKRLENELCKELNVTEDQFLTFLSVVAAAREPLPLGFVSKLLLPGRSRTVAQRKVNAVIACVSALLPVQDECIHFFHKSVKDWLIEICYYGQHQFSVDEKQGHEVLSKLCIDELDEVKRKGVDGTQFPDTAKYALRHGVQHMLQPEDARVCSLEDVVTKFVLDVELVYAKLCVNVTLASEDVVSVQKKVGIAKCHGALNTLLVLLRKYIATLNKHPYIIFQTLLNEGGPELSSQALNLLETKYSEMAYMEYLHKKGLQGRVQAKFECSATVACFDVSPRLDYMVCECTSNRIQLWSLHTGQLLWNRDAKVTKDYYRIDGCVFWEPYRAQKNYYDPSRSLYRSVVFHPTKDLVLPGILSHAYTFDGDLRPLFLSSKCCFYICSISADKTKMLTDCTNDAKSIIMWSLNDGSEINRLTGSDDIMSFAWSRDGRLLAVADLSGSIGLLDVMDDYRTLAAITISEVCGTIKFSHDCRCLYCLAFNRATCGLFRFDVNMENDGTFTLAVLPDEVSYQPWEFESCSETGFLLGDPFWLPVGGYSFWQSPGLAFILNKQSVLRVTRGSKIIEMLQLDKLTKDSARHPTTTMSEVTLSLNGDTLFVITTTDDSLVTLMAWDISSGMFKPGKRVFEDTGELNDYNLVAVREGVLLQISHHTLELWNFELSECIRSWTDLYCIPKVIPISEERVACDGEWNVIIVDTTREGILSTVPIHGCFIACNSKCHVITADVTELQMQCGEVVFWRIFNPFSNDFIPRVATFSPTEQYCVLGESYSKGFYVLDVVLGNILRIQPHSHEPSVSIAFDYKFVSDECVVCITDEIARHILELFNVKSGDLLSEIALEKSVYSLAACPRERLIGFTDSKGNFKVLRVKLPGDKHSSKSTR